eukprot:3274306-Rhodomonas_salina.1
MQRPISAISLRPTSTDLVIGRSTPLSAYAFAMPCPAYWGTGRIAKPAHMVVALPIYLMLLRYAAVSAYAPAVLTYANPLRYLPILLSVLTSQGAVSAYAVRGTDRAYVLPPLRSTDEAYGTTQCFVLTLRSTLAK